MTQNIRKQTQRWKTKDGHEIRLCDMSDAHLVNTLRFLRRKAGATRWKRYNESMNSEDLNTLTKVTDYFPIFESFCLEVRRRGLRKVSVRNYARLW